MSVAAILSQEHIAVLVKPGAKQTELLGVRDDRLHIALKAPPVDGKANEELCRFLGKLTKKKCQLVTGSTSKKKLVLCR